MIAVALAAQAANVVTLPVVTGSPGDEVTLAVSLTNDDAVSALQLRIPITDDISVVEGSATLSARAATTHSVTVGVNGGMLNIMVWSLNMDAISGSEGELLTFRVRLGSEPATVPLVCSSIIATGTDGNTVTATATAGSVTISAPKVQLSTREVDFGHVPIRDVYHRSVSVTNVGNAPLTVSGIDPSVATLSSTTAFPLVIAAGSSASVDLTYSPVERGAINETVRLLSDNVAGINTIRITADPFAVNELHVENASGIADNTVTISLRVNNMDAITGFQFEFDLPAQLKYVDGSFALSDRKGDHSLLATHKDGHLTAIAYSLGGGTFSGEDGIIATFDVVLSGRNSTYLDASKAVLTANYRGEDIDVLSAKYRGYVTIASPQLNAPTTLNLGATPVTQVAQGTVTVRNSGNAPLSLDRVVFDHDGFAITEEMPIVLARNASVTLHVSYDGLEETPFETWMQLYSNDPDHRLHNIKVTGSRFAPNYLSLRVDDTYKGDDVLVHIDMSNYDPINGLQFDVAYPAQCLETPPTFEPTTRGTGFTMMWRDLGNGTARVFIYSLSNAEIASGEGEVGTLRFTMTEDATAGDYTVAATSISLGTSALTDKFAGTDQQTTFQIINWLLGDVNNDGRVTMADVTTLLAHIYNNPVPVFVPKAADVNSDSQFTMVDVTRIIAIIYNKL